MKSLLKMTLISSVIVFALAGCDEKKTDDTNATQTTQQLAVESTIESSTTTNDDKPIDLKVDPAMESYALGVSYAKFLKFNAERSEFTIENQEAIQGFQDELNDKTKYTEKEVQFILDSFSARITEEQKARVEAEKASSIAAGDKFRADFAAQPNVKQTESGLLYEIITEGTGAHPTATDMVTAHYTGTFIDGTKFESSYDQHEPVKFPLDGVIKGWAEGLQLIGVGGKIKLVIPPELAYGDEGIGDIPRSSTLVFEVELLGINDAPQEQAPTE